MLDACMSLQSRTKRRKDVWLSGSRRKSFLRVMSKMNLSEIMERRIKGESCSFFHSKFKKLILLINYLNKNKLYLLILLQLLN